MRVVDHGPQAWFLFAEGQTHFLAARVSMSFTEYEILLELTPEEYREYQGVGRVYLEYLAARVQQWPSEYRQRDCSRKHARATAEAVAQWRASGA
ncbi:MAG TPA: hypothetical protein VK447_02195 [Myxococcaceae bacterium]|nr:hypothetical protein [Myxococcaceae bacterium]